MMLEVGNTDRLRYLENQFSDIYRGSISLSELGNFALRVIMARREAEDIIDGNYPEKEKRQARKELKHLKDLEKGLVYLYINAMSDKQRVEEDSPLIFRIT